MGQEVLILDSTQISAGMQCIQMWNLGYVENLARSIAAPSDPIAMGSLGHKYLEIYYKGRASGYGVSACLENAFNFNPDFETCKCGHAKEDHLISNDLSILHSHCKRCIEPKCFHEPEWVPYPLDKEKRDLVKERVQIYVYKYINNDFIPSCPDNVEVGFSYPLVDTPDKLYILEGRIDILTSFQNLDTYVDHKFQLARKELYAKSIQFKNYALVTGYGLACINYIRLTKKEDTTTYERKFISFNRAELEFWRRRLIAFYDKVVEIRRRGITPNDYNWDSCSGKYSQLCQFTSLCEESYNENVVKSKKENLYHIKTEWKPW